MRDRIERRDAGLLTYGITPPKKDYPSDKRARIAAKQAARIAALPVDGLVLYDIQDESARTPEERPFAFLETVDPIDYAYDDLRGLDIPKVVYRCVAPKTLDRLDDDLRRIGEAGDMTVFVGAASRAVKPTTRLSSAYAHREAGHDAVTLGGVLIAERHGIRGGEHERALRKMESGCSFFVSQAVYAVAATKNTLSDLHYACLAEGRPCPPVLVTLSPCGSLKTMAFMRWLGIDVPRWIENDLTHASDILDASLRCCTQILEDLAGFCAAKGIPLGCNVESVSLRRAEIDASVELVHRARKILDGM